MENKFELMRIEGFTDERGVLFPLYQSEDFPFEAKRIYFIKANEDATRANLAHKRLKQALVCVSGSCKVCLDDGFEQKIVKINEPSDVLFVDEMIWRKVYDFTQDAILLSLNSEKMDEDEIIRDYDEFKELVKERI